MPDKIKRLREIVDKYDKWCGDTDSGIYEEALSLLDKIEKELEKA